MIQIRIPIPVALLALVAMIAAVLGAQMPEIRRYLRVKSM